MLARKHLRAAFTLATLVAGGLIVLAVSSWQPVNRSEQTAQAAGTYDYQWLYQQYAMPTNPNTAGTLTVTLKNIGTNPWTNTGDGNTLRLGTDRPRDRASSLYHNSWISANRAAAFVGRAQLDGNGQVVRDGSGNVVYDGSVTTIQPGEAAHFSFSISTPNRPYAANEYFSPVVDGKTWLRDIGIHWPVAISQQYHAQWVGQSVFPTINKGVNPVGSLYFDYRNTGSYPWPAGGIVRLGADRSRDRSSGFATFGLTDVSSPALPANTSNWLSQNRTGTFVGRVTGGTLDTSATAIAPGETGRFTVALDARNVPVGSYQEYFRPVADGFAWLEDYGAHQIITVQSSSQAVAAAGDIACDTTDPDYNGGAGTATNCRMQATSNLLTGGGLAAVLPLGDLQYDIGALSKFQASYDPSWGRVKNITKPAPGNHEYGTANASGYYGYFGAAAGDADKGYYSFDVGSWHFIALNSNCSAIGGCGSGSPQQQWLLADLAANPATCTVAYWHHPRFSSGLHGSDATYDAFWQALYNGNADIALNGHDHLYERFGPQTPASLADTVRGIRQFTVGTGGRSSYGFSTILPNSQVRIANTYGVLKLYLYAASYDWQFVTDAGAVADSGSGTCH